MTVRGMMGFLVLLAAAAGTWYLSQTLRETGIEVTATPASQGGYYLRTARVLGTDADGRLLYEIEADFAQQIPDDRIEFQDVRIRYSPESDIPWVLNADTATVSGNRDRVQLAGHVVATSQTGFSGEVTEIRTAYLEFEPENFKAETDERVQVRIGSRSLTATGMLALLQDNRLSLKSNVSGKFVP